MTITKIIKQEEANMDFQHAKMTYMIELDNTIRYFRSGLLNVNPEEKEVVKQMIIFMIACKQMDMDILERERKILKVKVGNMLYETLESGRLSNEFSVIWAKTIHQMNMFYNKCHLLSEFMNGQIDQEEYTNGERKNAEDMVVKIKSKVSFESLEVLVTP
jgi:hypothetical protein